METCMKEHLLEGKQIFVHINNPPKKLATRGKIKPLGFQKVGHENGHPGVTCLEHLVVSSRTKKCWS